MMAYFDELTRIFNTHSVNPEAQAEIRHLFSIVRKDAERQGFSDGWNEGQSLCDNER